MSQADLISAMGLPGSARSWLAQVETGRTLKPDPERLRKIADVLGTVTYRELLAASDQLDVLAQPSGEGPVLPQPTQAPTDLSALIDSQARLTAAIEAQTAAITRLADQLATPHPDEIIGLPPCSEERRLRVAVKTIRLTP
jgi:transcriptional regulator with XRE-family HTH domain